MTAATLDLLSEGRFLLGLGTSGPQVVEGWHGEPWGKPLGKTREYVDIVRAALRRELLEHHGEHYDIPVKNGTGLGKPLKLMARPLRADIPIYLAAMRPKAVAQAFEIADGWLPIFWSPEKAPKVFASVLGGARPDFDVAPSAPTILIDDVEAGRDFLKPYYALYIGGMGARGKNFYNELCGRYGYEDEARKIQDLYLGGNKRDAAAAVPDAFVDEVALVGPKERLAERLDAWRESGVTSLLVSTQQPEALGRWRRSRCRARLASACSSEALEARRLARTSRTSDCFAAPLRRDSGTTSSNRAALSSSAPRSPRTYLP